MDESPVLALAEELRQSFASPLLCQRISKLRQTVHPPQLGASSQSMVHGQGDLVTSSAVSQPMQCAQVAHHCIIDASAVHDQRSGNLLDHFMEVLPSDLLSSKLRQEEADLEVLVLPHGDRLHLRAVRPQALSWRLATFPLRHRELDLGAAQDLCWSDACQKAHRAALVWSVVLAGISPCHHSQLPCRGNTPA